MMLKLYQKDEVDWADHGHGLAGDCLGSNLLSEEEKRNWECDCVPAKHQVKKSQKIFYFEIFCSYVMSHQQEAVLRKKFRFKSLHCYYLN